MGSRPLLFYDSGAGGLPYLAATRSRLPAERYIYLADRKHFPFGEKSAETLRAAVLDTIAEAVRRFDPKLIVVACNTASVVALEALRRRFTTPFVGVVPAVKPAALALQQGKFAVVATQQTAGGPYLDKLIQSFAEGSEVLKVPVASLVDFAEYRYFSTTEEEKIAVLRKELAGLVADQVQAVVLGCTHFVLLEKQFRAVLPDSLDVIDSREGVINRVLSLLSGADKHTAGADNEGELYLHGGAEDRDRYKLFAAHFGLCFSGSLQDVGR